MSTFQVLRANVLMKQTKNYQVASTVYDALRKKHPTQAIGLIRIDFLKTTPEQQAFNQKREATL